MRAAGKMKQRGGFSVVELVAVVVILGILFAFAAPALSRWRKDLKLAELDDSARSIFMAAQGNLTALNSSVGVKSLDLGAPISVPKPEGEGGSYELRYVTNLPSEKLKAEESPKARDDLSAVLPEGTIAPMLQKGYYVIEFDPSAAATVFGVFYAEKPFEYKETDSKIIDANDTNGFLFRNLSDRKSYHIPLGYHGDVTVLRPEIKRLPEPIVELKNEEELVLTITMPNPSTFLMPAGLGDNGWNNKVRMDVTLHGTDKNGNPVDLKVVEGGSAYLNGTYTIAIDTLKEASYEAGNNAVSLTGPEWHLGRQFKNWTGWNAVPGCDVSATVDLYCVQSETDSAKDDTYIASTSTTQQENSLFDAVKSNQAEIRYGRHLQNLDLDSWGTTTAAQNANAQKVTSAIQTREIYFKKDADDEDSPWKAVYEDKTFLSIYSHKDMRTYDGNNHAIYDLDTVGNTRGASDNRAGLFAMFNGDIKDAQGANRGTLQNVTLVDCRVRPHEGVKWTNAKGETVWWAASDTGSLAGKAIHTDIINCHVYLSGERTAKEAAGVKAMVKGGSVGVGGLVGAALHCDITNCSASTTLYASSIMGGLVGQAGGNITGYEFIGGKHVINITKSYAACNQFFSSDTPYMGGLVGYAKNGTVTITDCYAAGTMDAVGTASAKNDLGGIGGLVGCNRPANKLKADGEVGKQNATVTINRAYAAVELGSNLAKQAGNNCWVYAIAPWNEDKNWVVGDGVVTAQNVCYLAQGGVNYHRPADNWSPDEDQRKAAYNSRKAAEKACTYIAEMNDAIGKFAAGSPWVKSSFGTVPYKLTENLLGDNYTYYTLDNWPSTHPITHYGDWLENTPGDLGVFYWEKHGDSYRVYSVGWSGARQQFTPLDSLCKAHDCDHTITDYGYGLFGRRGAVSSVTSGATLFNESGKPSVSGITTELAKAFELLAWYGPKVPQNPTVPNTSAYEILKVFTADELKTTMRGDVTDANHGWLAWTGTNTSLNWTVNGAPIRMNVLLNPDFAAAIQCAVNTAGTSYVNSLGGTASLAGKAFTEQIGYWDYNKSTAEHPEKPYKECIPYQVRTVDQLQSLRNYGINGYGYRDWQYLVYAKQSHNIDGSGCTDFTPIGNAQKWFGGVYDGGCYQIRDLSIMPDNTVRDVGLFGLTRGAVLKNIVLYSHNATAQVRNSYKGSNAWSVGALVGVAADKDIGHNDSRKRQAMVENCAVAGYIVANDGEGTNGTKSLTDDRVALGGLIGWARLPVKNCAADAAVVNSQNSHAWFVYMGGLIGSAVNNGNQVTWNGPGVSNCYAGGVVYQGDTKNIDTLYQGGLVGGGACWNDAHNIDKDGQKLTLSDVYSYCHLAWADKLNPDDAHRSALWPRLILGRVTGTNGYYYDILASGTEGNGATGLTYEQLKNYDADTNPSGLPSEEHPLAGFGKADASHTYKVTVEGSLHEGAYPFPAVVEDHEENLVHYGTWPVVATPPQNDNTNPFYLMDCKMIYGAPEFHWQAAASVKLYSITWNKEGTTKVGTVETGQPIAELTDYANSITNNSTGLQDWVYLLVDSEFADLANWYFWTGNGALDNNGTPVQANTGTSVTIHDKTYYIVGKDQPNSYTNVGGTPVYFYYDENSLPSNNWNDKPEDNCTFYINVPYNLTN